MEIKVTTPCRLHFGLLDLNGELGRINGSLGVALKNPGWIIKGTSSKFYKNQTTLQEDSKQAIRKFDTHFNTKTAIDKINFEIIQSLPSHVGLGSNTQFLLALGFILSKIHDIKATTRDLAIAMERGGTSGIGVTAFNYGGIILDGGHSYGLNKQTQEFLPSSRSKTPPPPVIFRHDLPANWRFILITPENQKKVFGKREVRLFKKNCPVPSETVEKLSRLILVKILPAIVEKDIRTFGEGLTEMQFNFERFGMNDYSQGIYQEIFDFLKKQEAVFGYGISSFGPTVYALTNTPTSSKAIIRSLTEIYDKKEFILLMDSEVNNTGAKIE